METNKKLITAAGGNGTVIEILDHALLRRDYESRGKILERDFVARGVEQAGFLIPSERHFEMAGGEFCGNATRAAAVLLSQVQDENNVSFSVSGFNGVVSASVERRSNTTFFVKASFPGMKIGIKTVPLENGTVVSIVDLGGIVHVIVEGAFPADYIPQHRQIVKYLGLRNRDAVGVVWYQKATSDTITIHPVVWVRAVDTCYYESSCGSGTIAVGKVTGSQLITQPTGKTISVEFFEDRVVLASEMEIVY